MNFSQKHFANVCADFRAQIIAKENTKAANFPKKCKIWKKNRRKMASQKMQSIWLEKYRPSSLENVLGNPDIVE